MSLQSALLRSTALSNLGLFWGAAPVVAADFSPTGSVQIITPRLRWSRRQFQGQTSSWSPTAAGAAEMTAAGNISMASPARLMPLGQQWGLQIDGLLWPMGRQPRYGTAGHLFWRDPNVGLAGIYRSFKRLDTPTGSNSARWRSRANTTCRSGRRAASSAGKVWTRQRTSHAARPRLGRHSRHRPVSRLPLYGGNSALALGPNG